VARGGIDDHLVADERDVRVDELELKMTVSVPPLPVMNSCRIAL